MIFVVAPDGTFHTIDGESQARMLAETFPDAIYFYAELSPAVV